MPSPPIQGIFCGLGQAMNPEFDSKLSICPLCNSRHIKLFDYDFKGIEIYNCSECDSKFMNPPYSDKYYRYIYDKYTNPSEITEIDTIWSKEHLNSHDNHFQKIEDFIGPGKVLAFGCGNGLEIQIALNRNWIVHGFDIDKKCTDELKQKYKVTMYTGDFFNLNLPNSTYDCIYLDQVLEHLKNPADYLNEFKRLLKPDGILFMALPNITSISSTWKTILGKFGLKKQRGKHYDTWHHLFYFAPRSFSKLLNSQFKFETLLLANDIFTLPELNQFRMTFFKIMKNSPLIWRSTFYIITKNIKNEKHP